MLCAKDAALNVSWFGQSLSASKRWHRRPCLTAVHVRIIEEGQETSVMRKFKLRKILIAEKAFTAGRSLEAHVVRGIGQSGPNAQVVILTAQRIHELLSLGIEGADATLGKVSENEELETKLGKYRTRHITSTGKNGERMLEYHGWLTNEVPFGCAKFTIHEHTAKDHRRLAFTAVASKQGHDARSGVPIFPSLADNDPSCMSAACLDSWR
jgi:hypothetical protein